MNAQPMSLGFGFWLNSLFAYMGGNLLTVQSFIHTHSNDNIFHDSDKMPKHVEMVQTKCQPKIGTDKMPITNKVGILSYNHFWWPQRKFARKCIVFLENLQLILFYTIAGRDKSQLWIQYLQTSKVQLSISIPEPRMVWSPENWEWSGWLPCRQDVFRDRLHHCFHQTHHHNRNDGMRFILIIFNWSAE